MPWFFRFAAIFLVCAPSLAQAQSTYPSELIQAPVLAPPEKASLAGALAQFQVGAEALTHGLSPVPLSLDAPTDGAPLLAPIFPTYSHSNGLGEWGQGFAVPLSIERIALRGDIAFDGDEFSSPWGRLLRGSDGQYYPEGLSARVRVSRDDGGFRAHAADGTEYFFDGENVHAHTGGIYAWFLSRVRNPLGDQTWIEYETNPSGRRFVSHVRYGRDATRPEAEIEYEYEPLERVFVSYQTGVKLELDRRVRFVHMRVRSFEGDALVERYGYEFGYEQSRVSPIFFLTRVQKKFPGGAEEPAFTLRYDDGHDHLQAAAKEDAHLLADYVRATDTNAIDPRFVSSTDIDDDGRLDFENPKKYTLWRQTDDGWTPEELPPRPTDADERCRKVDGIYNTPRNLVRLAPGRPVEVFRMAILREFGNPLSRATVCSREGHRLVDVELLAAISLSNGFTRLADLNRDQRPDLITWRGSSFEIFENVSTSTVVAFRARGRRAVRGGPAPARTFWVEDLNGDGRVDLVARDSNNLKVWYGKGGLEFEAEAQSLRFMAPIASADPNSRIEPRNVASCDLSFADINQDGLRDVLTTCGSRTSLFIHELDQFRFYPVPALSRSEAGMHFPRILPSAGSGELEVVYTRTDQAVLRVPLERASTGLLTNIDDGRGAHVTFRYGRSPAVSGLLHRPVVLSSVVHSAGGVDDLEEHYRYAHPVTDPAQPTRLLGFAQLVHEAPFFRQTLRFRIEPNLPPLLESSESNDPRLAVHTWSRQSFEVAELFGIRFARALESSEGKRAGESEIQSRRAVTRYAGELCPAATRSENRFGTLEEAIEHIELPIFPAGLSCLESGRTLSGHHADATLDFSSTIRSRRNERGQIVEVTRVDPGAVSVLQSAEYDEQHRLIRLVVPGRGTTEIEYDSESRQVRRIKSPEGTETNAGQRHPVTHALLELKKNLGGGVELSMFFAYDELERLSAIWNSAVESSAAAPLERNRYVYASATHPGRLETETLVAHRAGKPVYRRSFQFFDGRGQAIAGAQILPSGTSFGPLEQTERNQRTVRELLRPRLPGSDPSGLGYADLQRGATEIERVISSALNTTVTRRRVIQEGVVGEQHSTLALEADALVETVEQDGARISRTGQDATGLTLWTEDPSGARTTFAYDAMGELVGVQLPDGKSHRLRYNRSRRVEFVERVGFGKVAYLYDETSGLPVRKTVFDVRGQAVSEVSWMRDGLGRTLTETHRRLADDARQVFHYEYDGGAEPAERIPGQLGKLTAVRGDGFEKRMRHDELDRLVESELVIEGDRTIKEFQSFSPSGKIARHRTEIFDGTGVLWRALDEEYRQDDTDRLASYWVNGTKLYDLLYDDEGRASQAVFPGGQTVAFSHDRVTQTVRGYWHDAGTWNGGVDIQLDARGTVEKETFSFNNENWERAYTYDERLYLASATDQAHSSHYRYDVSGLLVSIEDQGGMRSVNREHHQWSAGSTYYDLDDLGRVVRRRAGDEATEFVYGPAGELDRVTRGAEHFSFVHDDSGKRVAKRAGNQVVAVYAGDSILLADRWVVPVRVGDRLVGYLDDGVFEMLATDPRGTVFGERGQTNWSSPYGHRASRPEIGAALDFVEHGFDPDLGVIRMGSRDYDPYLGQFLTPDAFMVENLDACADRPTECNLYSYAANNPIHFVDPAGTFIHARLFAGVKERLSAFAEGFGLGAVGGFVAGAGVVVAVGAIAAVSAPVAAAVATTAAVGGAAYLVYEVATHTEEISAMAGRLSAGNASPDDWRAVGQAAGGVVGGAAGGRTGRALLKGVSRVVSKVLPTKGCTNGTCVKEPGCFLPGTQVATETGWAPIESLRVGTLVWAKDDQTGELALKPIQRVVTRHADEIVELELVDAAGATSTLHSTTDHPFWIDGRGWLPARELAVDDRVGALSGGWLRVGRTTRVQMGAAVWNLQIEGFHTYFVGELGAWTHNTDNCFRGRNSGQAGNSAAEGVVNLSRAQARNLQKIENILANNAKPGDFTGVASELAGKPIPKPGGGVWDHVTEMRQSVTALQGSLRGLRGSLENPNMTPATRAAITSGIERAESVLLRMQSVLGGGAP